MIKRTLIAAAAATLFAVPVAPASAQEDVCVTYDFTGRQLCVFETLGQTPPSAPSLDDTDVCVTYDFTGRDFCVIRDTIGA
ncbi:MAG: hypothetical protein AVDCRST_MAG85-3750 [uncultured Solirubrobacteraceae bacterium]|uniref:Uncharacterized protein n=1 Tax=uncultured Solirubrobacteraceae bacterium TaxID=1162706 RepID=A0A6J4TTJ2_9ACTN|nr:MAG: hypothetical protein AVDCRST_MAG85-3750 [uncultured Solirubrobacteraceae bacterium]